MLPETAWLTILQLVEEMKFTENAGNNTLVPSPTVGALARMKKKAPTSPQMMNASRQMTPSTLLTDPSRLYV
jgi:hypothetical protein